MNETEIPNSSEKPLRERVPEEWIVKPGMDGGHLFVRKIPSAY